MGLHLPREGLDLAFGQEPKTAVGHGARDAAPRRSSAAGHAARRQFRQPTPDDPLRVLVTGDSQAEFVGQRMLDVAPDGLLRVDVVARNGTGLTRPEFFNWEVNAKQEIADRRPDAVVMVMGGNDGFNVTVDGSSYGPFTPEWETEYARRTAVVMRELGSRGRRPVYWAPSPTARDEEFNRIYRVQNFAVGRAAPAVPGARYVDLYDNIDDGRYRNVDEDRRPRGGVPPGRRRALHPRRGAGSGPAGGARDGARLPGPGPASLTPRLSSWTGRPASWPGASTRRPFAAVPRTRCRPP